MSGLLPEDVHPATQKAISELAQRVDKPVMPTVKLAVGAVPQSIQVSEGGCSWVTIGTTLYLYTKYQGALYRVAMTAV